MIFELFVSVFLGPTSKSAINAAKDSYLIKELLLLLLGRNTPRCFVLQNNQLG